MPEKRFLHPVHARGVQCSKVNGHVGGPLTDRKIEKYIRQGYYGQARQQLALQRKTTKRTKSTKVRSVSYDFTQLLNGI